MTTFPFDDPAWDEATDAYLEKDTRDLLSELAQDWDEETADHLFFSALLHQGTVYSATFLALPHIVALADAASPEHRRIATLFLGGVALHACFPRTSGGISLAPGDSWAETPTGLRAAIAFNALLPDIARLCASAYSEEPIPYYASGLAAAMGDRVLAEWLESGGPDGQYCHSCGKHISSGPIVSEVPEVKRLRDRLGPLDPETERLLDTYRPLPACPHCGYAFP